MGALRGFIVMLCFSLLPIVAQANDRLVKLYAPDGLVDTGVLKFALPRFSLKTQVRVELVGDPAQADMVLGDTGQALFQGAGQTWHMHVQREGHSGTQRFSTWLTSDVGKRTILGFAPDGDPVFSAPTEVVQEVVAVDTGGDAVLGREVSRAKCQRCHRVDENRMTGIGSTPSFAVLRSLSDWEERFSAFYALNPHPSFTIVKDITPPFPADRPSPIVPVVMTLDEVEAVLAYVAVMNAAELGAPLIHQ